MQPITPSQELSPIKNEYTPLTKEVPLINDNGTKDHTNGARDDVKMAKKKDEPISLLLSNEDLKEIYIKKKGLKETKERFHFQDAHQGSITSVAITSDNRYIISGSFDKSIKVFDLQTKKERHPIENAHQEIITSVALTSDNRFIVSCSYDKSIKIFDFHTREQVHHFQNAHENSINRLTVTSDNKYIVSVSRDGSIKVFDFEARREVHHFQEAHENEIFAVAVTPDSKYIVSGAYDQSIKVFDIQTKQEVHHFKNAHPAPITSLTVTSDNSFMISACLSGSIKVFDLQKKQEIHYFQNVHQKSITSVVATSDNRFVISGSQDKSIKIFDLHTKQEVHCIKNAHPDFINAVAVTSDSRYIISGSFDQSLKVFDLHTKQEAHHFHNAHQARVTSVVITQDNKYMISGSDDLSLKLVDLDTKQEIHRFQNAHESRITSVALTTDNKLIVSADQNGDIKVFDFKSKQEVHHFQNAHDLWISSLAITPDDRYIISGSYDKSLKVLGLHTRKEIYHFQNIHQNPITSVAVTSDNQFIISGSEDKSIKIFNFVTRQEVYHFQNVHQYPITSVAVSSDNKFLISASQDKSLKILDVHTKQEVYHFQNAHEMAILSVAVTSDNQFIISGSRDKSIKVFDLHTRQEVHHFQNAHKDWISSVAVTSDNRYIISGSLDKSLKVFDLQTKQEVQDLISEKNKTLNSGSTDKSAKIFDLQTRQQEFGSSQNISIYDSTLFNQEFYFIYDAMKKFSVFNGVDDFLFNKPTEYSVSLATKQPELFVLPFRWTILHIVSVFAHHDFIAKMPEYSEFQMPFLLDSFNRTPFHYLIAHKNMNFITVNIIFRYVCDYLEDCYSKNPFEFQKIIESLCPLLPFILQKIDIKSRQKFLQLIYTKSPAPHNSPIPMFGEILSEAAFFCDSPVLTQETRDKIWNESGTSQVEFRSNFLSLDYDISSQDMKEMVDCLKEQKGEEIFKTPSIVKLIDHLWRQAEIPLFIFFAFYSMFIIALSVYLTLRDRSLAYEITLLVISVLLTANELWQVFNLRKSYIKDLWNWFDLAHLLLTLAFLIVRIADNDNELARAWISTIIIALGYLRWIALLKIFKPTRNLIQVVITIVKDMTSFIIVIALIIIGFSVIFLVFNREDEYGAYLYQAYNVLYGPMDIEEDAPWPFSQKLIMAVLAFFLNVVLLNLLISVMGDSYGQVLEMRDRTDSLTRLEMISEAAIYRKFLKSHHQTKRGYLVECVPVELEQDENNRLNELESVVKSIKTLQKNQEDSKQEIQSLKETMKNEISTLKASNEAILMFLQKEFSKSKN